MFAISVLFNAHHREDGGSEFVPGEMWEEIVFLVDACIEDEAIERVTEMAMAAETQYVSVTNEDVYWKFMRIFHVSPLEVENLRDGSEVFSRFLDAEQVESLSKTKILD